MSARDVAFTVVGALFGAQLTLLTLGLALMWSAMRAEGGDTR